MIPQHLPRTPTIRISESSSSGASHCSAQNFRRWALEPCRAMGRIESSDIAKAFLMAARGMDLHAAWVKCGQPGTWGNVQRAATLQSQGVCWLRRRMLGLRRLLPDRRVGRTRAPGEALAGLALRVGPGPSPNFRIRLGRGLRLGLRLTPWPKCKLGVGFGFDFGLDVDLLPLRRPFTFLRRSRILIYLQNS